MSGPKTGRYVVISGRQEIEREFNRARGAAEQQLRRLRALEDEARVARVEFGDSIPQAITVTQIPSVPGEWRIVKVQEWTEATRKAIDGFEDRLKRSIVEARRHREIELEQLRIREIQASERTDAALGKGLVETGDHLQKFEGDAPIESPVPSLDEERLELWTSILARLDFEADDSERDRLMRAIDTAVTSTSEDGRELASRLIESELADINSHRFTLRERRRQRIQLLDQLEGLDCAGVDELRTAISEWAIDEKPVDPGFQKRIDMMVDLDRRAEEQAYALRVARECLEEIGYEVEPGFETSLQSGQMGYARSPQMSGYAVRIRADASGTMAFNVVRSASEGSRVNLRDREVEESWCTDLASILVSMRAQGVEMSIARKTDAGATPVMIVDDLPFVADRSPLARRTALEVKQVNDG